MEIGGQEDQKKEAGPITTREAEATQMTLEIDDQRDDMVSRSQMPRLIEGGVDDAMMNQLQQEFS